MAATIAQLMAILPNGKANAIHAADLAALLGYSPAPNQEELRALIRYAIDQGELIGSSSSGYWIIDSIPELDAVLDSLEGRAQGTCDRRNNIRASWNVKHPNNQTTLPDMNVKP